MTNYPAKLLDADENPIYQKSYNEGTASIPSVPVRAIDGPSPPTPLNISFASTSNQTLVAAPGVGNRIRVTTLFLSSLVGNFVVSVKSGSTTIATIAGISGLINWVQPLCLTANEALVLQSDTANQIYGHVSYWVESISAL